MEPDTIKKANGMIPMERVKFWGSTSPNGEKLRIFEAVVDQLTSDFGTWELPWGEVNRYQRLNGDIRQAFNDIINRVFPLVLLLVVGVRWRPMGQDIVARPRRNCMVPAEIVLWRLLNLAIKSGQKVFWPVDKAVTQIHHILTTKFKCIRMSNGKMCLIIRVTF